MMLLGDLFAGYVASAKGCLFFPHAAYTFTEVMENHI